MVNTWRLCNRMYSVPVGAGLMAVVVNEHAHELDKHGVPESIASKPNPTNSALSVFSAIA
jgi:hypothetical protein